MKTIYQVVREESYPRFLKGEVLFECYTLDLSKSWLEQTARHLNDAGFTKINYSGSVFFTLTVENHLNGTKNDYRYYIQKCVQVEEKSNEGKEVTE